MRRRPELSPAGDLFDLTGRAVVGDTLGEPETYRLIARDPGPPGPGEVRVALKATGISHVDVLIAAGQYQVRPPVPFVPGSEGAGVVEAIGPGVENPTAGERVIVSHFGGLFADAVCVPVGSVAKAPAGFSFAEAAVFRVSYTTARYALLERGGLCLGETVLVLGAGGATGFAAVQLAHHAGARVIASASSEAKRALARAGGADAVVAAGAADWRDQVRAAAEGDKIDVVFDPVGGSATESAFRSLGWGGRHLVVGFTAGIAALPVNLALLKGGSLIGVELRQFGVNEPERAEANARAVFELAEQGVLRPPIGRTYPLEEFAAAMGDVARGETVGRVVLTMERPGA